MLGLVVVGLGIYFKGLGLGPRGLGLGLDLNGLNYITAFWSQRISLNLLSLQPAYSIMLAKEFLSVFGACASNTTVVSIVVLLVIKKKKGKGSGFI